MTYVDGRREDNPDLSGGIPPEHRAGFLSKIAIAIAVIGLLDFAFSTISYFTKDYLTVHLLSLLALVKAHTSVLLFQILFVAIVLVISASLYLLRETNRRWYAVLEILFGMSAADFSANGFYLATEHDTQFRNLVAALGGIYIIIRGLDNWRLKPPKATQRRV
jgi:hypothetical protein